MINRLKRKFTILATASMVSLMTVLIVIINILNFCSLINENDTVLKTLSRLDTHSSNDIPPPEKPVFDGSNLIKPDNSYDNNSEDLPSPEYGNTDNSSDDLSGVPSIPNGGLSQRNGADEQDFPSPNMNGNTRSDASEVSEGQTTDKATPSATVLLLLAAFAILLAFGLFTAVKLIK